MVSSEEKLSKGLLTAQQMMEKLALVWEDWTAHDDTYVVEGENVVVLARYTARHPSVRHASLIARSATERAIVAPLCVKTPGSAPA